MQSETFWQRVLRCILGVLFLWAAASKLANPLEFLGSIYAYELPLPMALIKGVAVVLPWVELVCGLLLLGNQWTETALTLVGGLLVVFVLATGQAWVRGLSISCGCFNLSILGLNSADSSFVRFIESPGVAFFRNLVLLSIPVWLMRQEMARAAAVHSPASSRPQKARSNKLAANRA